MQPAPRSLVVAGVLAGFVVAGCGGHSHNRSTGKSADAIIGIAPSPTGKGLRFLPGGATIALDQLEPGWRYRFIGELYRQGGRRYFYIVLQNPGRGQLGARGAESLVPQGMAGPFAYGIEEGCAPRRWVIVYGLIADAGSRVTAVIDHATYSFKRIPIPTSVSPGGALAYLALPRLPDLLTVRGADGRVLTNDSLGGEVGERCQPGSIVIAGAR